MRIRRLFGNVATVLAVVIVIALFREACGSAEARPCAPLTEVHRVAAAADGPVAHYCGVGAADSVGSARAGAIDRLVFAVGDTLVRFAPRGTIRFEDWRLDEVFSPDGKHVLLQHDVSGPYDVVETAHLAEYLLLDLAPAERVRRPDFGRDTSDVYSDGRWVGPDELEFRVTGPNPVLVRHRLESSRRAERTPVAIERHPWLALPLLFLGLFMVHSMVEYTGALGRRETPAGGAEPAAALAARLAALTDPTGGSLTRAGRWDFEPRWQVVDPAASAGLATKLTARYRARVLLDELRHEVRWFESIRTASAFVGFDGWRPRFTFPWSFATGDLDVRWSGTAWGVTRGFPPSIVGGTPFDIDTRYLKRATADAARRAGWSFRVVYLPFQATRRGLTASRALLPPALRTLPSRVFWGFVYPFTFVGLVAALLAATGGVPSTRSSRMALAIVVGGWWATWSLLAWIRMRVLHEGRSGGTR